MGARCVGPDGTCVILFPYQSRTNVSIDIKANLGVMSLCSLVTGRMAYMCLTATEHYKAAAAATKTQSENAARRR